MISFVCFDMALCFFIFGVLICFQAGWRADHRFFDTILGFVVDGFILWLLGVNLMGASALWHTFRWAGPLAGLMVTIFLLGSLTAFLHTLLTLWTEHLPLETY